MVSDESERVDSQWNGCAAGAASPLGEAMPGPGAGGCVMGFLFHRGKRCIEWGEEGTGPLQQSLARPFVVPAARPQTKEQSNKLSCSFPQAPQAATPLDSTLDHQA